MKATKRIGCTLLALIFLLLAGCAAPPALKSNPIIEGNLLFHTTFQQYIPYKRYGK